MQAEISYWLDKLHAKLLNLISQESVTSDGFSMYKSYFYTNILVLICYYLYTNTNFTVLVLNHRVLSFKYTTANHGMTNIFFRNKIKNTYITKH